jgi:hypothetical protein
MGIICQLREPHEPRIILNTTSRFNSKSVSLSLLFLKNSQVYVIIDYLEWTTVREAPLEGNVTYAWYILKFHPTYPTLHSLQSMEGFHILEPLTITLSSSPLIPL